MNEILSTGKVLAEIIFDLFIKVINYGTKKELSLFKLLDVVKRLIIENTFELCCVNYFKNLLLSFRSGFRMQGKSICYIHVPYIEHAFRS